MYLHPTNPQLGHNCILKQLIKVVLILNKSSLVHFEQLWSSPLFFFSLLKITFFKNAGSHHNTEPTNNKLSRRTLTMWPSSQRGHILQLDAMKRREREKKINKNKKRENIWAKCTQIRGGSGEERTKRSLNKTQKYSEKLYM